MVYVNKTQLLQRHPFGEWGGFGAKVLDINFKKDLPMTINLKNRNFMKLLDYTRAEIQYLID
ncbi:hypothetical protein ACVGXT_10470, partial [Enterobacter intestinihominis]